MQTWPVIPCEKLKHSLSDIFSFAAATGLSPEFLGTIRYFVFQFLNKKVFKKTVFSNLTISHGRDASFACSVRNLGGYKVNYT